MNIKVYVRIRPKKESEESAQIQLEKKGLLANGKKYDFDEVFSSEVTQSTFYSSALEGFIGNVIDGYNCTFFAYGQTGTGKTFTMEGEEEENGGVIPRVINELFMTLEKRGLRYRMRVTHVEIYNEKVYDLLSDQRKELTIRERKEGNGASPDGATELTVTKENVHQILAKSSGQRRTAATDINPNSSRSHCIFTVTVQIIRDNDFEGDFVVPGRIHCVDLAGSENSKRAGIIGDKVKQLEGMAINQSLLALNRVIIGVSKGDSYIPFRSSPLTRILQDALGGASVTAMVATISPAKEDLEETLSTLEYAKRVKTIKNTPKQNASVRKDVFLQKKLDKIVSLKRLITDGKSNEKPLTAEEIETLQMEVARVNQQNLEMQALFAQAKGEVNAAQEQLKSALNYINLKRQSEIELKTMLRRVVKSIEVLSKQSRKLEDVYERNNELIKQNDDTIKQMQEDATEMEKNVVDQFELGKKEIIGNWDDMERKMEESDRKGIMEGISFGEFNQQCICKDALSRMEGFCCEGMECEISNRENTKKVINWKDEMGEEIQRRIERVEYIEKKEVEEKEEEVKMVEESLKGIEEEIRERRRDMCVLEEKRREEERNRVEKRKIIIEELNDAIEKSFYDNGKRMEEIINNIGVDIDNGMEEWNEKENSVFNELTQEKEKRKEEIKETLNQKIKGIEEIKESMSEKQRIRESIQQSTVNNLQELIKEMKELMNNLNTKSSEEKRMIEEGNTVFINQSQQHIKGIIQTIDLGIGENGIVGALVSQINEIIGRMKQKTCLSNEVQKECIVIKDKMVDIKRKLMQGINNINDLTSVELKSLEITQIQSVSVPTVTLNPRMTETPTFGLRLSEKIKHLDNL